LEQLSKIKLTTTCFWVKAYKVSGIEQTPSFATLLGNKIGTFVDREKGSMYSADGSL